VELSRPSRILFLALFFVTFSFLQGMEKNKKTTTEAHKLVDQWNTLQESNDGTRKKNFLEKACQERENFENVITLMRELLAKKKKLDPNCKDSVLSFFYAREASDQKCMFAFLLPEEQQAAVSYYEQMKLQGKTVVDWWPQYMKKLIQSLKIHDIESFKGIISTMKSYNKAEITDQFYYDLAGKCTFLGNGPYAFLKSVEKHTWGWNGNKARIVNGLIKNVIYFTEESNKVDAQDLSVNFKDPKKTLIPLSEKFFLRAVRRNNLATHTLSFAKTTFFKQTNDQSGFCTPIEEV
jgi:hypothetical protein